VWGQVFVAAEAEYLENKEDKEDNKDKKNDKKDKKESKKDNTEEDDGDDKKKKVPLSFEAELFKGFRKEASALQSLEPPASKKEEKRIGWNAAVR
jgi:hypothetical protein